MQITDIVYRKDLYPRFEPSHKTIQKYSESIEFLPPILVNQDNILIDGFHRWKAHELAEVTEIKTEVVQATEQEVKILAYKTNSIHGLQLTRAEKKKFAIEMFGVIAEAEIMEILSVEKSAVYSWTEDKRKAAKEDRNRQILDLYLRCNTQQEIADAIDTPQKTIDDQIKKFSDNSENGKLANLFLYNIWNTPKQNTGDEGHFGSFPYVFMENLLHYHTEPFDIVYDPFAGGGTTVDTCRKMNRRFICSDRKVKPGREDDIISHDVNEGLPEKLKGKTVDMAFLDPPYWLQAEGMYSDDSEDLGNMSLDEFNSSMEKLLTDLTAKKTKRIAIVIQPTQYKNDWNWQDHVFDFAKMLPDYKIEMRYILPYSTQQYNAQMVEKAKEGKHCLCLNRDLIVWSLK